MLTCKGAHGILLHAYDLVCCCLHCQAATDLSRAASINNGVIAHLHIYSRQQHTVKTALQYPICCLTSQQSFVM
jgi:hypothetical protein